MKNQVSPVPGPYWAGPDWRVLSRVLLGLLLLAKGVFFLYHFTLLQELLARNSFLQNVSWLALLITCLHLMGGWLVLLGLFTRAVLWLQLPLLVAALLLNLTEGSLGSPGASLLEAAYAALVFVLTLLVLIRGAGNLSLDQYFFKDNKWAA